MLPISVHPTFPTDPGGDEPNAHSRHSFSNARQSRGLMQCTKYTSNFGRLQILYMFAIQNKIKNKEGFYAMTNNKKYLCPICGNTDSIYLGIRNSHFYCRKCIAFRGKEVEPFEDEPKDAKIHLTYRLSKGQKELSRQLVSNYKNGINSLVKAVCGSGKTEIVINSISYAIKKGLKVAFVVPRRDVAVELYLRFKDVFADNKIALVYGGHHEILTGDLVCMTAHQLFRYENYFDLIVMDEIDAFPYKGNEVLQSFFNRALKGNYILLSATPSEEFVESFKKEGGDVLELFIRFHRHPLPVPKTIVGNRLKLIYELIKLVRGYMKANKPVFIFTPTIDICENIFNLLHLFIRGGNYVHSKHPNRAEVISAFRKGKYKYLVTTAVLERGVTIKNLQVIIYRADHNIYDQYSLVQIAGRVGRKKDAPKGEVIYLAEHNTIEMDKSIKDIQKANKTLQNLLQNTEK